MSLGVALKGPEGIVLAADSRVTLGANISGQVVPVYYDNASKVLALSSPNYKHVGAVTYGAALVAGRTAHSYLPEIELRLPKERITVRQFAEELSSFFMERWTESVPEGYSGPPMTMLVGGYDKDQPYGAVFLVELPNAPKPEARNAADFGLTWGGQSEVATRLIHGFDPVLPQLLQAEFKLSDEQVVALLERMRPQLEFKLPYAVLPLQDCVDLATFLIRTTITAQSLAVGIRGVGGQIEVAVITRTDGLRFVQRKSLRGEAGTSTNHEGRRKGEHV